MFLPSLDITYLLSSDFVRQSDSFHIALCILDSLYRLLLLYRKYYMYVIYHSYYLCKKYTICLSIRHTYCHTSSPVLKKHSKVYSLNASIILYCYYLKCDFHLLLLFHPVYLKLVPSVHSSSMETNPSVNIINIVAKSICKICKNFIILTPSRLISNHLTFPF
ncbi:hypothetical protein HMPREF0490_00744 [Lachnospiraceae bacterium 6_1_37FAA]|nr:hypothetical protein HMPREF0490_00744 [Lachnospiraceae bacterium 6_1_37FAA]